MQDLRTSKYNRVYSTPKKIFGVILWAISVTGSEGFAKCLNDYHIRQKNVAHNIPEYALKKIDELALAGNPAEGWYQIGLWGDEYAAVAAKVLAKKAEFPSSFYNKLIVVHWENANNEKIVAKNFWPTAKQHFRQYVELLHTGYWPDSDQIVMSYLKAVRAHHMPDVTVFDAAWDASGYHLIRTWQSLNHLKEDRTVYPSKACYRIDTFEANKILAEDFLKVPIEYLLSE